MPLIRNNGRYGELGHWGKRSGRRFTKKKILLLVTLLSLSILFGVSKNTVFPIPVVNAGDYNTSFSHTRTNIFNDQNFNGPTGHAGGGISFNSKVNATCAISCASGSTVLVFPALTVSSGDTIIFEFWASSAIASTFTITDTQSNSYVQKVSFIHSNPGLNVFIRETQTSTTGSDTITLTSSAPDVFAGVASDYSGAVGFGNTATNGGSGGIGPTTGTSTITITSASSSSFIVEFMAVSATGGICTITAASSQTLRNEYTNAGGSTGSGATDITGLSGSQNLGLSWSCGSDQDQFSHAGLELTQSPLNFQKVRWNYNSTCVSLAGPVSPEADFDYSIGNNQGVATILDSNHPSITNKVGIQNNALGPMAVSPPTGGITSTGEVFVISGSVGWQIGSTQFLMNESGTQWTGSVFSQIFAITGTPGTTAIPAGPALATSASLSTSSFTIGTARATTFTFTNSAILVPGTYFVTVDGSTIPNLVVNSIQQKPLVWRTTSTYAGHNNAYDTLNSTGQSNWQSPSTDTTWFTVTGLNTNPGINCSSADIMISKASINLQTVSARMLEMVMAWSNVKAALKNVTMVLRSSNGTLPSFTENYNPFNDIQARLIWWACPTVTCTGGNQTVFIGHDNTKTVNQETQGNDKIIGLANPNFKPGVQNSFQTVLNFTGPNNFISGSNQTSTTQNSASGLQMGQDYYILIMANFDTTQTPASCNCILQFLGGITSGTGNPSLGIWSVPASCQDPINRVACGLGTPQPTFDFNPLDPSTWGNAIIKGLVWAFSVAVPSGLLIIAQVLLQVIQVTFNFVGNFFGWGNIGDNIVTFLSALPTLFGQIGTALGWFASIVSGVIQTIIIANLLANPYFAGLVNVLNDFKNAIGSGIIISFLTEIAIWFPTSYMIILISTYFLFVLLKGLHGFFDWLHLVKWSSFQLVGLFSLFIDVFVSLITAILGRLSIISPGHKFPRIPHPDPGSLPKISLGGEIAFFDDPTAWFLGFMGLIFTMMWAGTSSAGLPANTQTVIQAMTPLFTTLFGVGFMILLLYIPGFVLGKLHEKGMIS